MTAPPLTSDGTDSVRAMGVPGPEPANGRAVGVMLAIFNFPMIVAAYRTVIDAQSDMAVVAALDDRTALRDQLPRTQADVVITECMPYAITGCSSFQAIEEIRAVKPALKILAIGCRCGSDEFSLAIKAGADGFLTREAQPVDVVEAVHRIARGETYVSPAIVTRMVNTYVLRTQDESLEDPYQTLSERERDILLLAAQGHTNREIAKIFHLSEQTVHNYRASLMEKLGFHDRVDLLKFAIRRGVIDVADL